MLFYLFSCLNVDLTNVDGLHGSKVIMGCIRSAMTTILFANIVHLKCNKTTHYLIHMEVLINGRCITL